MILWLQVSDTYFDTLGIARLAGRTFTLDDRRPGANTVIVGERLARRV